MSFRFKGILTGALLGLALQAHADLFTYTPSDNDLEDLNHDYAYQWGLRTNDLRGKTIVSVNLYIDNIRDWTIENDDVLYIRLLPNATSGIRRYYDNEGGGDYFRSRGINLVTYHDLLPYTREELRNRTSVDLSYDFTASEISSLMSYAADGNFGFGFDPDCHYFNDGIRLTVRTYEPPPTPSVPEPGTMALMALGLLGLGFANRRKRA